MRSQQKQFGNSELSTISEHSNAISDQGVFEADIIMLGKYNVGKSSLLERYHKQTFTTTANTIGIDFKYKLEKLSNGEFIKMKIWDTAGSERYQALSKSYINGTKGAILVFDVTDYNSFLELQEQWMQEINDKGDLNMIKILVGNKSDLVKKQTTPTKNQEQTQNSGDEELDQDFGQLKTDIPLPTEITSTEEKNMDKSESENNKNEKTKNNNNNSKIRGKKVPKNEIVEFCKSHNLKYYEASAKEDKNVKEIFKFMSEMTYRMYKDFDINYCIRKRSNAKQLIHYDEEQEKIIEVYDQYFKKLYQNNNLIQENETSLVNQLENSYYANQSTFKSSNTFRLSREKSASHSFLNGVLTESDEKSNTQNSQLQPQKSRCC